MLSSLERMMRKKIMEDAITTTLTVTTMTMGHCSQTMTEKKKILETARRMLRTSTKAAGILRVPATFTLEVSIVIIGAAALIFIAVTTLLRNRTH
jgi:hypothetical protein